MIGEGEFGLRRDERRVDGSLVRSFGGVIVFEGFRADSFFGEEFGGGAEEVVEESPFLGVEVIEERDDLGVIEALVAEPLADVGPVFLFDVGVVLFVVGAAAGEVDGFSPLGEVAVEVVVEELGAVVGVEAEERERERGFDMLDLLEDTGFPFAPYGSLFGPAGGDIDGVEGIGEHAGEGIAAVGDGIGFEEAGAGFIPLIGFDGDLATQEGTGFGSRAAPFFIVDAGGGEDAVDGGRGDAG